MWESCPSMYVSTALHFSFVLELRLSHNTKGGSLFFVSERINSDTGGAYDIYVLDGQNTQLLNVSCVPSAFAYNRDLSINIVFDADSIQSMDDWHPRSLCEELEPQMYMFSGATRITFRNLIVDDYVAENSIFRSSYYFNGFIACFGCAFRNVSGNSTYALFYTMGSIRFEDTVFSEIHIAGNLFDAHSQYDDDATREFVFLNSSFARVAAGSALLYTTSNNNFGSGCTLKVKRCYFDSVSTTNSIIYDETDTCDMLLSSTSFDVSAGSIYYSEHRYQSNISLFDVSVHSDQLYTSNHDGLFFFASTDNALIDGMNVSFSYDADAHCDATGIITNDDINASFATFSCSNPVPLLTNNGEIEILRMTIDVQTNATGPFTLFMFESYGDDVAFIINSGTMTIDDARVYRTISSSFIYNSNSLSVSGLVFGVPQSADFDPNSLQSSAILEQSGSRPSLTVVASTFVGSEWHVYAYSGEVVLRDSSFENSSKPIDLTGADSALIYNCTFVNNGQFNGPFLSSYDTSTNLMSPVQVWSSQDVLMANNVFSGYDHDGLVYVDESTNVSFRDNVFIVNASHLFYDVDAERIGFEAGQLTIAYSGDTHLINNELKINEVNSTTPWIWYDDNDGVNCLTGNSITNYAMRVNHTNLTSCFRTALVQCAFTDNISAELCSNQIYGDVSASLSEEFGAFIVDGLDSGAPLMSIVSGTVALDNVEFVVRGEDSNNMYTHPFIVSILDGGFLLVDSLIRADGGQQTLDVSFFDTDCIVEYNDRLSANTSSIARIFISCSASNQATSYPINNTMKSANSQSVEHLSLLKINFVADSATYYPGQMLTFSWSFTDRDGRGIDYDFSEDMYVVLDVQASLFATYLTIDNSGMCPLCTSGIIINTLSLAEDVKKVNRSYALNISVDSTWLISEHDSISLDIVGCPVGWGPDSNDFTCQQCNTGSFNDVNESIEQCKPCDPDSNPGISCADGRIDISSNFWMGFQEERIISSECPAGYCCSSNSVCNYLDDTPALCASNRNSSTRLCGQCNAGFSEPMGGTNCVRCEQSVNVEYLLYPLGMAVFWSLYLVVTTSDKRESGAKKKEVKSLVKRMMSNEYLLLTAKTMWSRNIMYYQQAIAQILSTSALYVLFVPLSRFFNFSIMSSTVSGSDSDVCFIDGMTAKHKIIADLTPMLMLMIFIFAIHIVSRYGCNGSCVMNLLCFGSKTINIWKLYIAASLLFVGNILSVLLRLLNCKAVGPFDVVHFYFGDEDCYGLTWLASLFSLLLLVAVFMVVFFRLRRMDVLKRQSEDHPLNTFMVHFKPQYYFWEFVLLLRRISIALLSVSVNSTTSDLALGIVVALFLFIHLRCQPFISHFANEMETVLLVCLIIVIMANLALPWASDPTFIDVLLSSLIVLPFCFFLYFIRRALRNASRRAVGASADKVMFHIDELAAWAGIGVILGGLSDEIDALKAKIVSELEKDAVDAVEAQLQMCVQQQTTQKAAEKEVSVVEESQSLRSCYDEKEDSGNDSEQAERSDVDVNDTDTQMNIEVISDDTGDVDEQVQEARDKAESKPEKQFQARQRTHSFSNDL